MNINIKTVQDFDMRQKLAEFSVQAVGNVVAMGVVVFLILVWVFTSPLIQLIDQVTDSGKTKTKNK
jgi:hypothetical protein